ncbi:MAG: ABC transporter substrate-binding protein [Prevotella sp.]|nr:ABC transporter substrate-binding protein [Prevotella sp.]
MNTNIKGIYLFISIFLSCLMLSSLQPATAANRDEILKVYNWADYIDEDLILEFEKWYHKQTGKYINIVYQTFDINETMLTEIEVGHEDYDVVCPSEYIIERMLKKKLLQPIRKEVIAKTNTPFYFDNVSKFATDKFQQMAPKGSKINVSDYAVGYMWGTTGFMYNKKYLTADDLQSWGALYDPRYIGKILIKDAFRDVYSCLICYARYDDIQSGRITRDELVGTISTENIMLVENMLRRAKPNIFGWEVDFGKETMTKGKAWANMTWSGDAAWAIEEAGEVGVELDYLVPQEGSNVWFDGWVIPIYSKNPVAASYFINFMCMSENALRNMNEIGYVSVIGTEEVLEGMTDDSFPPVDASYMFGDAGRAAHLNYVYYPDKSVIDRCALMHDCGEKTEAMVEMWSRVKGDSLNVQMIVIICTVIGTILFFYFSRKYRLYRRKVHRRRRLALLSKTQ